MKDKDRNINHSSVHTFHLELLNSMLVVLMLATYLAA